jgi:hypothetical protein
MRPYGRLPKDQNKMVPATVREVIPMSAFGVAGNSWTPSSITEEIQCVYMNDRLDKGSAIGFRVLWSTGSATITDSATFKILYTPVTLETDALPGIASTALSTAITADIASATADILKVSPQGLIAAETITDGDALVLNLSLSAVSGLSLDGTPAEGVVVYGVEIEYVTTYID